jgi:IS5 family transposase
MLGKILSDGPELFRSRLDSIINPNHELVALGKEIDWKWIEEQFIGYYAKDGRPSVPVRKMVGLLLLKQLFNESDESVIDRWIENPYWQYFTGETYFQHTKPFDPTDFVLFRRRVGQEGMEKILTMSLKLHPGSEKDEIVQMDTTCQEKNITYPTDQKLCSKIMYWVRKIAEYNDIKLRQSYQKEEKKLERQIHFSSRKKGGLAIRARSLKRLKTITGRLIRDVRRKLSQTVLEQYVFYLDYYNEVYQQSRYDKNKVYSLHEPDVSCIAKGKVHKKYEFGAKISVSRTAGKGVIVGMLNFLGNPYDGDTIEPSLQQILRIVEPIGGQKPQTVVYDRGGRGRNEIDGVTIKTPGNSKQRRTEEERKADKALFRARAGIEPDIGHLKSDYGMARNFLRGILGDAVNALLAGAAFNLKMRLNEIKELILFLLQWLFRKPTTNFLVP